jgi:hypothetical protein
MQRRNWNSQKRRHLSDAGIVITQTEGIDLDIPIESMKQAILEIRDIIIARADQNVNDNIFIQLFMELNEQASISCKNLSSPKRSRFSGQIIIDRFFEPKKTDQENTIN